MTPDRRIANVARRGAGVFRRRDALEAGLTPRQIRYRVREGTWVELRPGIFHLSGFAPDRLAVLRAATLGTNGVASHRSAAWLHELTDPPPLPEVTLPIGRGHHHARVRVHRTADLARRDVQQVKGIACTTAVRTLVDLGARLDLVEMTAAVDQALHHGLVTYERLALRARELARPDRDGGAMIRAVLDRLDPATAPAESELETRLIGLLRAAGVPLPVCQHAVEVSGRRYRLDAAYPELMLAIECDGYEHHRSRAAFESDRRRQNDLVSAGWTVLRFTWDQITRRPTEVVATVRAALERSR